MLNPLVSIIIPCFNQARFLPDALGSVLNQTCREWECIIVNDGSSDETDNVAREWLAKDCRFHYFVTQNRGPSASRNLGIRASKGDFIQFLDADDLLECNKLAYQLSSFEEEQQSIDIAVSGYRFFVDSTSDYDLQIFGPFDCLHETVIIKDDRKDVLKLFALRNPMVISAPLYRRRVFDAVGLFDETLLSVEDWDFHYRCALQGCIFHHTGYSAHSKTLVRVHSASTSYNRYQMNEYTKRLRAKHKGQPFMSSIKRPPLTILEVIRLCIPPIVTLLLAKSKQYILFRKL